jgi:tRNA-2-methylthio-N6-dimethylallyladenosine synthase
MSKDRPGVAKRLFIKTYGCQMNVYDSSRMAEALAPLGVVPAAAPEDADLVIVNTCHVREHAAARVYSELGRLARLKTARASQGERLLIAVAGCVAQAEGAEMMRRQPAVDLVLGPQSYHRLPEAVARLWRAGQTPAPGQGALETAFEVERKFDELPRARSPQGPSAFLTVQEGCDKFCSFCVVPYTRGAEYSRPPDEILAEARDLVEGGAVEITLLGQNVNAYRGTGAKGSLGLGALIRRLAAIDGLVRLRYTTSHPRDMGEDLIEAHRDVAALMPFLHLPVQSGSDKILAAMNRRHGAADYLALVERLRSARPDLALSSDFIVGYPGEREEDFAATLDLVRAVDFAQAYAFKYSPRPGTPAALASDPIAEEIKEERLARLNALVAEQQQRFNRATIGRRLAVLLDRKGRRPGQLAGRSPYMQAVHLEAPARLLGRIVEVEIVSAHGVSVAGRAAQETERPIAASSGPIEEVGIQA